MRKLYILPALISVLIFMLCGCETVPNTSSGNSEIMLPLFEPDIDFSIPDSFSATSTESNNTAYICDNASIIVNEDYLSESVSSLNAYVAYSKELYQSITDKYTEINQEEININGLKGIVTEFDYEINGKNDVLSMSCIVGFFNDQINNPSTVYVITCKSDSESYPDFRDSFIDTIRSVKPNQEENND